LQERSVVDAPLTVIVAVVAIFNAAKVFAEAGATREFVEALHTVLSAVHKDGVVASLLKVLAESVKVVVGVWRSHKVVFHHRRYAGQNGRQHFETPPAVRHAVEGEALTKQGIKERSELETTVVAVVTKHFLTEIFHDDDDQIARNRVHVQCVAFDETVGGQVFMDG
jgi:hypothetical protein